MPMAARVIGLSVCSAAIMLRAGEQLDRTLIDDSFACRVGRGSVAAVLRAQHYSRRFAWYAKLDIAKYFHNIDQRRLLEMLERRFRGPQFMELLTRIIASFQVEEGKGLPIGALTSQVFANLYGSSGVPGRSCFERKEYE